MEKVQDLLAKIKTAKEANGLSYQAIVDITEKNGEAVSLSTVKRVLQDGADIENFRYQQTILPIARAVLGINEETEKPDVQNNPDQPERYYAEIDALKSVIKIKHEQLEERAQEIDRLRNEISDLKETHKANISHTEEEKEKKITYLKDSVEELKKDLRTSRRIIAAFSIVIGALLVLDVCFRNFGWFQW